MDLRQIAGLSILALGLTGTAVAAEKATLADAAENGKGALVRTLLDAGENVNTAQVDGMTALHWATYNDDGETAALLVRSGANVNGLIEMSPLLGKVMWLNPPYAAENWS